MKPIVNEKGYALLMVLLLIVLFTVLGMGLMATNMNSAKQFSTKENNVQARHYAEMGLLHYQLLIDDVIKEYKFSSTKAGAVTATSNSRVELCNKILNIGNVEKAHIEGSYKVPKAVLTGCSSSDTGKINISVKSTGVGKNGSTKLVEGNMGVAPPNIEIADGIPGVPVNTSGKEPLKQYPVDAIINSYVELDAPFITKKQTHHYESFHIKSTDEKAFEVQGGSADTLKVEKDLYIAGGIHSQNHVCIYVKGNLTILGKIKLGTHSMILVYGNAYLKNEINNDIHTNAKIYVMGDTYVGEKKELTTVYKKFDDYTSKCPSAAGFAPPVITPVTGTEYKWNLDTNLNAIYH